VAHAEVLRQKERAQSSERAKDRFLANVSHEIRTPLNAIIGFTDLLLYERHDAQTRRYLGSVRDAGANLLVLINDVLDLSRMEAGRLTLQRAPFDLHRTLGACVEMLEHRAREQHDRLSVELAPDVPRWVLGDAHRLTQMLLNLMGNALKFTTHGSVTVAVDIREVDVRIRVSDTGIGIAPDKLKSVFERFTQVHNSDQHLYGGTGLGLSIVKELVTLHQGQVDVESEVGRGTTFTLLLPYAASAPPAVADAALATGPGAGDRDLVLQDRIILVAEDNPLNAQVTTATLKRHYPHVGCVVVGNGREAVERIVADIDNDIALVLMDVQMPVLDGLSATREVRALRGEQARLPIVALTASVSPGDLSLCIEAGMDACVPKPFRAKELVDAIARLTGDGGVPVTEADADPGDVDDATLFRELVPERLQRLRSAREQGDHEEMRRLVHFMRFQLVRYDEERFAAPLDRMLRSEGGAQFDDDVDLLIAELEKELA
jgi:CheY-like chemotaxis protein/anti-sigma regulatory factor (Ser/Thr protein kinase)